MKENNHDNENGINTYSPIYSNMHDSYQKISKRESIIQIIGSIFIFLSILVEYAIFRLAKRLVNFLTFDRILRFTLIFIVLFLITILATVQLIIISNWNKNIKRSKISLTKMNYNIINRMKVIETVILLILLLCFYYFMASRKYFIPLNPQTPEKFTNFIRIYNNLLRISRSILFLYFILEIWQLFTWSKKIRRTKRIEKTIMDDMPNFEELADLDD